jgi:hypothetical protein
MYDKIPKFKIWDITKHVAELVVNGVSMLRNKA